MYKSRLWDGFDGKEHLEEKFRQNSKQFYPATELGYVTRIVRNEENELIDLVSPSNIVLVANIIEGII